MYAPDYLLTTADFRGEQSEWLRNASFYSNTLDALKQRIDALETRVAVMDWKKTLHAFEEKQRCAHHSLLELVQDIEYHAERMLHDELRYDGHLANHTVAEHDALRERVYAAERSIAALRHDFYTFSTQCKMVKMPNSAVA
jgi:hypothetical protein